MSVSGSSRITMGFGVAAIAIALVAIFVSTSGVQEIGDEESEYLPQTRDIYLFTMVDENIDEEALEIPPDQFSH